MKKVLTSIIMFMFIFILCGCSKNDEKEELKDKVIEEINYLDKSIIYILNELNNITFENYKLTSDKISIDSSNSNNGSSSGSESSSGSNSGGSGEEKGSGNTEQSNSGSSGASTDNSGKTSNDINITEIQINSILQNDEEINWDIIAQQTEVLNSSWTIIIVDLYKLDVNGDDILAFSSTLNDCIVNVETKNKENTIIAFSNLYSYLSKFMEDIGEENGKKNVNDTKTYIVKAYSNVNSNNWLEASHNINNAEASFKDVISDVEYTNRNEYKVNKSYILINELKNSMNIQDKKLFFIKYKNAMESLETL